jgi:hypothetical protein
VALPLGVGDKVKFTVGLEELREIFLDSGRRWNPADMKKVTKMKMFDQCCDARQSHRCKERAMFYIYAF